MKVQVIVVSVLLALEHGAGTEVNLGAHFGPQNCVKLSRSAEGSCVISTNCKGLDTSSTEFAFDCSGDSGDIVRHSFGFGGFDDSEEFDTEVKCKRCHSAFHAKAVAHSVKKVQKAAPQGAALRPLGKIVKQEAARVQQETAEVAKAVAFKAAKKAEVRSDPLASPVVAPLDPAKLGNEIRTPPVGLPSSQEDTVQYGPSGCISTYKSGEGHCIMKTDCKGIDLQNYEFGLVCVDDKGYPVKHLFGKGSFDQTESFDTLVKCDKCLGLEDIPDAVHLAGEVATMSRDIAQITSVMKNISINVQMLNQKVFPQPAAAPAPSPAAPPAIAKEEAKEEGAKAEEVKFIRQRVTHGNLRRHRFGHHHHRRYYDDDEDDRDDDRDEREDRDEHKDFIRDERDARDDDEEDSDGYDA